MPKPAADCLFGLCSCAELFKRSYFFLD